jgi:hypothetical protein
MVLQILLRQIDFGSFLLVIARRIILAVFVPAATSSTMVILHYVSWMHIREYVISKAPARAFVLDCAVFNGI